MATLILLRSGLVFHITGITLMIGIFLAEFVTSRQIWNFISADKDKARFLLKATSPFPLLQGLGGLLIILGGILMMMTWHGTIMGQLWFQIKMGLLVLLILNAVGMARPARRMLRKLLKSAINETEIDQTNIGDIKKRLKLFYISQLLLFWLIIILAIFKFN